MTSLAEEGNVEPGVLLYRFHQTGGQMLQCEFKGAVAGNSPSLELRSCDGSRLAGVNPVIAEFVAE